MADHSYYEPFAAFCKRDNYDDVFREALDELAAKVDFAHVKSCVAFGPGGGEQEIKLARRLMTNLRSFAAVEDDSESVKALLENYSRELHPAGVETSVVQTTAENWYSFTQ